MYIYIPRIATVCCTPGHAVILHDLLSYDHIYLAPGGGCDILFSAGLSVCVSVCICVSANIFIFYFSATRRDIDLKCIQDTYGVVINSPK